MRVLLIGEYSGLHNTLKEGLQELGHNAYIVSDFDFKKFPADYSIDPKFCRLKTVNIFRQLIFRLFRFDIAKLELGVRFYLLLPNFKNYDVVQFINEIPVKTTKKFELYLLKKIFQKNKKVFILSSGADYLNMKYDSENRSKKSILHAFYKNKNLTKEYAPYFDLLKETHKRVHAFVFANCNGVIAKDFDYVDANKKHPKYLGLIPYPVNITKLNYNELIVKDKIVLFLGINQWSYNQKGFYYFEKALEIIQKKYQEKVEIIITKNVPYQTYINLYNRAHILLDQSCSCDQGYNALEAMAKGKVVFTGAEHDFIDYYKLKERVCVNAKPDIDYLVKELSFLIENPNEMIAIGKRARAFVKKEHDYIKITERYLEVWNNN
jgi:glycosyltransferase involved in cell wall biosynthesis